MAKGTFVFIDNTEIINRCAALGWRDIDFVRLRAWLAQRWPDLRRVMYYSAVSDDPNDPSLLELAWLSHNGYIVVRRVVSSKSTFWRARSTDVMMAVDAMGLVSQMSECVFFIGHEDLDHLVVNIRQMGPKVTVVSSRRTTPPVADILRRSADVFLDLAPLQQVLEKAPATP